MENKQPSKVITIAHYTEKIKCDNCREETYHNITMQFYRIGEWKAKLTTVCWRCRTSEAVEFFQEAY